MSYPDLPKNRLIVDGVDLTAKYRMILMDGYKLEPPAPKTYTVDIPGGDGVIDLTDVLTGGPVYSNRNHEFSFAVVSNEFERVKSEISKFLHGRAYDYKITMDPEYTYHGRFTITSYTSTMYDIGEVGIINISISADPYKSKGEITQVYNSSNGVFAYPISGYKSVQPRFEFSADTVVIFGDKRYNMPKGTYTIEDIWFKEGMNEVFLMSQKVKSHITYSEMAKHLYRDVKNNKRIYNWYKGITKYYVDTITLEPIAGEVSETTVNEIIFTATDANGEVIESSLKNSNGFTIRSNGEVSDSIEIKGNVARLIRRLVVKDGSVVADVVPTVFTHQFDELFSNNAEIVSLSSNFNGKITYTVDEINTEKSYERTTYYEYSYNGSYRMTYEKMKSKKINQLAQIDLGSNSIYETQEELVYLNYEWRDL